MKYQQLVSMPSAVSDWLEEQLEARGIDAVVYTRYVLSLLHSSTVDVIDPDEDLQLSHLKKAVSQSSGSRKHFHQQSDWWRYADIDAEQLKRSAAIQCLLSASDQNCEIESLIDELCEKLKKVGSETSTSSETEIKSTELRKVSPQELARQYYAAFPPLSRTSESPKVISLPKWIASSKKEVKSQNGTSCENNLRHKMEFVTTKRNRRNATSISKSKKKDGPLTRSMAARSLEFTDDEMWRKPAEMEQSIHNNGCIGDGSYNWYKSYTEQFGCVPFDNHNSRKDDEVNMYDDLPANILDFLDSPVKPQKSSEQMMNHANIEKNDKGKFIPYGANIRSIWSNEAAMEDVPCSDKSDADDASKAMLDQEFGCFSLYSSGVTRPESRNGRGSAVFNTYNTSEGSDFSIWKSNIFDRSLLGLKNDKMVAIRAALAKINHHMERSPFFVVFPKSNGRSERVKPRSNNSATVITRNNSVITSASSEKGDCNLYMSEHSHFIPIPANEKREKQAQGNYADGTTFRIADQLDKVDYKRSETGTMYLESEFGMCKKYYEYKRDDDEISVVSGSTASLFSISDLCGEFVLKFNVRQNDKSCQTETLYQPDSLESGFLRTLKGDIDKCELAADNENEDSLLSRYILTYKCTCTNENESCPLHPKLDPADSLWMFENKRCEKCNSSTAPWTSEQMKHALVNSAWNNDRLRNIWREGEVCLDCPGRTKWQMFTSSAEHNKLREDVSQDGEKLLSHLSCIQKIYMEDLPVIEPSYDILHMYNSNERKRRHSMMMQNSMDTSNYATRFETDYVTQMSQISTLRAVTF